MSSWPQECETGTNEAEIMAIQESRTERYHWQRKHKTVTEKNLLWCSLGNIIILRVGGIAKASNSMK